MLIGAGCRFYMAHLILSLSLVIALPLVACKPTKTSGSSSSTKDTTGQSLPMMTNGPGMQRPVVPATKAATPPVPKAGANTQGRTISFTRQKDGALLVALKNPAGVKMSEVTQVRFTPDGKLLAIATKHKELLLWSVTSQKITQLSTRTLPGTVEDMRVSPDGRWLAMTGLRSYLESAGGGRRSRAPRMRRLRFEYFLAVVDLKTKLSLSDKWETNARLKSPSFTADSKHLVVLRIPRLDRGALKLGDTPHPHRPTELLAYETQRWKQAWRIKLKKGDLRVAAVGATDAQVIYSDYRNLLALKRASGKTRKLPVRHSNGVAYLRVQHKHRLLLSAAHPDPVLGALHHGAHEPPRPDQGLMGATPVPAL